MLGRVFLPSIGMDVPSKKTCMRYATATKGLGEVDRGSRLPLSARNDPKAHDDLRLAPPFFSVVVQRRHEEDALVRLLVVEDLNHDGERLGDEQAADDD